MCVHVSMQVCVCVCVHVSVRVSNIIINFNKSSTDLLGSFVAVPVKQSRSGVTFTGLEVCTLPPAASVE